MIRFIYIYFKSVDIKNEFYKKLIFRDNSRFCSFMIIFLIYIFLNFFFSVVGLLGELFCGLYIFGVI